MSWTVTIQIPIGATSAGTGASNALAWKREIVLPDSIKPKQVCCIFWDVYTYRVYGHAYGYLYLDGDYTSESFSITTTKRQWSSSSSYTDIQSTTTVSGGYNPGYNVTQVQLDSGSMLSTNNNYSNADAVFNAIGSNVYLGRGNPAAPVARAYFDSQVSKPIYVGVNGKARQVKKMYVGVNGTAREVKAIYVGVNGRARKVF